MKSGKKLLLPLTAAGALVAVAVLLFNVLGGGAASSDPEDEGRKSLRIRTVNPSAKSERKTVRRSKGKDALTWKSVRIDDKSKPEFRLDEEEEAKLSDYCKRVLKDVQNALDKNDWKTLVVVLEKIKVKMVEAKARGKNVNEVIPEVVRVRAIEACGWFGADALPELVEALSVEDIQESPEVVEKLNEVTVEGYQDLIDDPHNDDYARAEYVKQFASFSHDSDGLDSIFMSINDMRNSVIADTVTTIMESGTDEAKALMQEQVEFFTESEVKTTDDVAKWLEENPDDEDADEFYAPLET